MKVFEHQIEIEKDLAWKRILALLVLLAALPLIVFSLLAQHELLPFTGSPNGGRLPDLLPSDETPSLAVFRSSVMNGTKGELTGVWVEGLLAYEVIRGDGLSVPQDLNTASIYGWAAKRGVTAVMIHNDMGGTALYELKAGTQIAAVYGDGQVVWYVSRGITAYEAQSYSADGFQGPFRSWDCIRCSFDYSVEDIQQAHYTGTPHLAFQTCLEGSGRMGFIVVEADPIVPLQIAAPLSS
jgi:hypothetical protein